MNVTTAETHCSPAEPIFDSGGVWKLFRTEEGYRIECHAEGLGPEPYKVAEFDSGFTRGTITLSPRALPFDLNPLEYPLDEVSMAHLLGRGRGVELHSCGVIDSGGLGHVFVGVSGAGKTTTARLWEGRGEVVSDDRVIIRERDGAMWMFGTPWHGEAELSLPDAAPLAAIYLLTQAAENEIRPLSPGDAVARLFSCTFPLFHEPAALAFTLGFLEQLTRTVPVRELRFRPDPSVVDLVQESVA